MRPSARAVLRLTTSSNLVSSSTGRSDGLAPFRIFSTRRLGATTLPDSVHKTSGRGPQHILSSRMRWEGVVSEQTLQSGRGSLPSRHREKRESHRYFHSKAVEPCPAQLIRLCQIELKWVR
jgi:hypothetical protein